MTTAAKNIFLELDALRKQNAKLTESRDNLLSAAFTVANSVTVTDKDMRFLVYVIDKEEKVKKEILENSLPY